MKNVDSLIGKLLTLCDAMLAEPEQKHAFKHLVRETVHDWHDDRFARFDLDVKEVK